MVQASDKLKVAAAIETRRYAVLISGKVCSGKTALAEALAEPLQAEILRSRQVLETAGGSLSIDRLSLQRLGQEFDRRSGGTWIAEALVAVKADRVIVDAVRTRDQVAAVGAVRDSVHIHLTAAQEILRARYRRRSLADPSREVSDIEAVQQDETEAGVDKLGAVADSLIDTGVSNEAVTLALALRAVRSRLDL